MADVWHYTREGKQMEPVSGTELKQLAAQGLLKPTDFVWNESLPTWVRASAQNFFSEKDLVAVPPASDERPRLDDAPRRSGPRPMERHDEDDYDDRPRRRRRRPPVETGMNPGLKVGLIVGGSLLGLVLLVVIIVAFKVTQRANQQARVLRQFNNPPPFVINQQPFNNPNQKFKFVPPNGRRPIANVPNLEPPPVFQGPIEIAPEGFTFEGELNINDSLDNDTGHPCKVFAIKMEAGKKYTIQMNRRIVNNQFFDFDPFLRLEDKNFIELKFNDDRVQGDQNSLIVFSPERTDEYRIIATSFNGVPGNFTLLITEN